MTLINMDVAKPHLQERTIKSHSPIRDKKEREPHLCDSLMFIGSGARI